MLSGVSPLTVLSRFAAAAITGGNPCKTTLQSWNYTMLAFAFQRYNRLQMNEIETTLFAIAGLLLVLPSTAGALFKLLIGVDLNGYIPLLPQAGLHIGYNWMIAALIFVAAHTLHKDQAATSKTG